MTEPEPSHPIPEVDPFDAAANEWVRKQDKSPIVRCWQMASDLEAIARRLSAPVGPDDVEEASRRDRYAATVARMWAAYVNEPRGEWGPIMAIGRALALAWSTYAGKWLDEARSTFFLAYTMTTENGHAGISAKTRPFVDDAIKAWGRTAGAPTAKDRKAPKKWEAFAALVKAMGYGDVDPKDLSREFARQKSGAVKKGRKARH